METLTILLIDASYILLGIGFLALNIALLFYFFKACKDIQLIKKNLVPNEKDFYDEFLKLISRDKHKEASKILHEHVWKYSKLYQKSLLTREKKDPDKEKEDWAEYIEKYKDLFELVGEKPPTLLSTSIIKKAEVLIKNE